MNWRGFSRFTLEMRIQMGTTPAILTPHRSAWLRGSRKRPDVVVQSRATCVRSALTAGSHCTARSLQAPPQHHERRALETDGRGFFLYPY